MTQHALQFSQFDAEAYFVRRLAEHGRTVFAGISDPDIRRERIRQAILDGKLDCAILGRRPDGKPETYQAAFERHYQQPLHVKQPKERPCT
jgi:hypothetical protein